MPIEICDSSGRTTGPAEELATPEAVRDWVTRHATGPVRAYVFAHEPVISFFLGAGFAGGVQEAVSDDGPFWFLEEGQEDGEIEVMTGGRVESIPRSSGVSIDRLIEVLTHYLDSDDRPAGRWRRFG